MEGNMVLRMKKVRPGAQLPQRQTAGSAGFDLCACIQEPVVLEPGDSALFPTGLAAEIPQGHVGLIFTRSGLGSSMGLPSPTGWASSTATTAGSCTWGCATTAGRPTPSSRGSASPSW